MMIRDGSQGSWVGRDRTAVTLIELIIVLAIVTVLATLAMPRLDATMYAADGNVRLVRSLMQYAQRRALQQQHDVIVSIDVATNRIGILEDQDNDATADADEPMQWRVLAEHGRFVVPGTGVNGSVAAAIVGDNLKTIDGLPSVIFHRSGSASSSAEVYLGVSGKRTDWLRSVTLLRSTGRTSWYKYVGTQWKDGRS
jgi:prepilin-type N-terminal cleavage/methylation domain-containing protein